jgi:hypothetical protein
MEGPDLERASQTERKAALSAAITEWAIARRAAPMGLPTIPPHSQNVLLAVAVELRADLDRLVAAIQGSAVSTGELRALASLVARKWGRVPEERTLAGGQGL